jgi:hypothetical protein
MNNLGHREGRTEYEHEDTVNPLAPGGERDNEPVLLPSVAAVAAADEAISMAERRAISQAKMPFNNSRMLAYKQRLEGRVAGAHLLLNIMRVTESLYNPESLK